jgi:pimeloyl-ACP methyl ester carboxylesterase
MAYDAIAFIAALDLALVDLMGFSIGSFVAQQISLTRPALVRAAVDPRLRRRGARSACTAECRMSSAPPGTATQPEQYLKTSSSPSPQRGGGPGRRISSACSPGLRTGTKRRHGRPAKHGTTPSAGGDPGSRAAAAAPLSRATVFVANCDSDPMISPHYSFLLGLIPQTRVKIYPDSVHGVPVPASRGVCRGRRPIAERSSVVGLETHRR